MQNLIKLHYGQPGPHLMVLINHQKCFTKVFQRKVVMIMRMKKVRKNKTPPNFSTLRDHFFHCTFFFVILLFLTISTYLNFWNTNNCYPQNFSSFTLLHFNIICFFNTFNHCFQYYSIFYTTLHSLSYCLFFNLFIFFAFAP